MKMIHLFLGLWVVLVALFMLSCTKPAGELVNDPTYIGWAVGDIDQGYGSVMHTANDGMAWDRQGSISYIGGVGFRDVSVVSKDEVWIVGDTTKGFGGVWYTRDAGINWFRKGDSTQLGTSGFKAVWAKNGRRVWIAGDRGKIAYSGDAGLSWTMIPIDTLANVNFTAVSGDSANSVWVVGNRTDTLGVETGPVVLHSSDNGSSWEVQSFMTGFTGHVYDVSVVNDSVAWIAAGGYIFATSSGGTVWEQSYAAAAGKIHSVCANRQGVVWAGGEGGVVYHRVSGLWNAMNPLGGRYTLASVTMADSNRVWLCGYNTGLTPKGVIIYTRTSGRSWFNENFASGSGMRRISFANGVK